MDDYHVFLSVKNIIYNFIILSGIRESVQFGS